VSTRFGLVGTGFWADTCHAAGLAAHPGVAFTGIWGRDAVKAAALADHYDVTAEPNLDELLSKVDAVAFAVPPDVQARLACRAAEAGCHLLLEKPLAFSERDAEQLVDTIDRSAVQAVVFFSFRFAESTAAWLEEHVASEWDGAAATLMASVLSPDSPFSASKWRHERGALWDAAPHTVSLLLPLMGPVDEVIATRGPGQTVHLALKHQDGGLSHTTVSLSASPGTFRFGVELWGPSGFIEVPKGGTRGEPYARALDELLAAINTGTSPSCDAQFGLEIVRVLAAAERFLLRPPETAGERPRIHRSEAS